jgi:hypothetical protein
MVVSCRWESPQIQLWGDTNTFHVHVVLIRDWFNPLVSRARSKHPLIVYILCCGSKIASLASIRGTMGHTYTRIHL